MKSSPADDAGDDERAACAMFEGLRCGIRSDRRCDVLGRVRSGMVCFVGLHRDHSCGGAAIGVEERTCW